MRKAWWLIVLLLGAPPLFARREPASGFAAGSIVTTDYLGGADKALAAAVDREGRIVVAGYASEPADEEWDLPPSPDPRRFFAVARYTKDGALDPTFGSGGKVTTPILYHAFATSLLVTPSGSILASGYACRQANGSGCDFAAARYRPDGALDPSFGSGGVVTVAFPGASYAYARAATLLPGGGVVLAGNAGADVALAQLDQGGRLDASFGSGGRVTAAVPPRVTLTALAAASGGRLVASASSKWDRVAMLLGFRPDGSPDASFGSGGRVTSNAPGATFDALVVLAGGRLLAGGGLQVADPVDGRPREHFFFARYEANGTPDAGFGSGGSLWVDVSTGTAAPWAPVRGGSVRALQTLPGGSTAAAGTVWTDIERARFAAVFLDAAGSLTGNVAETDVNGSIAEVGGAALLNDGTLVVAGAAQRVAERADQSFDWVLAGYAR